MSEKVSVDRTKLTQDRAGCKYLASLILERLGYEPEFIRAFVEEDKVVCSASPVGVAFFANDEMKAKIAEIESDPPGCNVTVYAIIDGAANLYGDVMKYTAYLYVFGGDVPTAIENLENGDDVLAGIFDKFEDPRMGYRAYAHVCGWEEERGSIGVIGHVGCLARTG